MGILILFIILMACFVFGETVRLEFIPNVFIKPLDIAVFIIAFFGIGKLIISKKLDVLYKDKIFKFAVLFFLIGFVSLLFNSGSFNTGEFFSSLLYGLRFVLYALIFIIIKNTSRPFTNKIIYVLIGAGCVILTFGFIQYFFYSNLRNLYYLGWDDHLYRLFSTFLDPNFAASFFVLFIILLFGIFFYFLNNKKRIRTILTAILILLTFISIYLTFSRSGLIMLFASIFVFLILVKKLKWILIFVFVYLIFSVFSSKSFNVENINPFRIASSEARLNSVKDAIQIIVKNPILGVGFNSYKYAQIRNGLRREENALLSHADAGTDNSFLFVLATTGIVGFLAYIYLLYRILKLAYLKYKSSVKKSLIYYLSITVIASFIGIIIDSMFINSLFYSFNILWLWVILGLMDLGDSKVSMLP